MEILSTLCVKMIFLHLYTKPWRKLLCTTACVSGKTFPTKCWILQHTTNLTGVFPSTLTNTNTQPKPIRIQNSILAFHFHNFSIQNESLLNSSKYFITLVNMASVWECKSNLDILECKKMRSLFSIQLTERTHLIDTSWSNRTFHWLYGVIHHSVNV